MRNNSALFSRKSHVIVLMVVLSLLIALAGYIYYRNEERTLRREKEAELKAIAEVKIKQIAYWYKDELSDAAVIAKSSLLADGIARYLNGRRTADRSELIMRLNQIKAEHGYQDVVLASTNGKVFSSTSPAVQDLDTITVASTKVAVKEKRAVSTDIYKNPIDNTAMIEFIALVHGHKKSVIAAIVFRINPQDYLFPLVEFWPTPGNRAEMHITRKEGESIIVLNGLKHLKESALRPYPVDDREAVVVKAAQGFSGVFDARDYRGMRVVAYAGPVPGTPWLMVAHVEREQFFEDLYFRTGSTITISLLFIVLAGVFLSMIYRNRSEEVLRRSESLYRSLFDNHSAVGLMLDPDTGKIIDANNAAVDFYGWSRERLKQMNIQEINTLPPEELRKVIEKIRSGEMNHFEFRHRRADGSVRHVEVFSSRIATKEREILHSIIHDITDRKQAEDALRQSEANLKNSQEIAKLGSWTTDFKGRIFWSEEAYRIYGVNPETFVPTTESFMKLIHPDDRHAMQSWITACMAGEKPGELVFRSVLPDGSIRFISGQGELTKDHEGRPLSMSGTAQDITEHRRLEDQLRHVQKLEGIGQLAGGIAHDFNNVLNAVMGFAGLLQLKMDKSDPLMHFVEEIIAASQRGAALTQQILAFSRKQVLDAKPVNLNEIIKGIEKMLYRLVREDITIRRNLYDRDLLILADASQIGQVIINIVTNARDAMPKGGIIGISTESFIMDNEFIEIYGFGRPGEYALLTVSDTGFGMDEETKAHMFEPFFTTKEIGKGTGLGLAVVHGIVKQHNGYIHVVSAEGKGTQVAIYLPLLSLPFSEDKGKSDEGVIGGNETILIAEDDESLRNLSVTLLNQNGYRVIEAVDGEDAITKTVENKDILKLVILDGIMPKKSGKEAFDEIRRLCPDIKAIFFSGYAEDIFSFEGIPNKDAVFVQKPVHPYRLLHIVREVLDG